MTGCVEIARTVGREPLPENLGGRQLITHAGNLPPVSGTSTLWHDCWLSDMRGQPVGPFIAGLSALPRPLG